ncbi:ribosomal biogenesis protein LAS1L [Gouania willdenowi]|uniref:LAS1-like protein n=1 Tax=Gouania willdenowi TaxID=441366 RepID=A0A8C5E2M6_GOUWI|nr:ribosomal biogenesis protein LAS1L [Gouania willdenowi]
MKKRSSEKRTHVVAWLNKAEWDRVLECLYSTDVALQRFALHRISAWKSRYAHSTPVAVGCTADLVRCQVLDRSGQLGADDLVLLYGAALVRFVNLITERQQGRMARPLRKLAGNLNIPEWVVDLRHDFTHRKLPTLKRCRKGCDLVMQWLQQEYWSRQLGGAPQNDWDSNSDVEEDYSGPKNHDETITARQKEKEAYKSCRELLISYEKEQYEVLSGPPAEKDQNLWPSPLADMSWILGEIKHLALEFSDLLVDVLLEDGFLVPTAEQLETLGCSSSDADDPTEPRLPQAFLRFWLPLLKTLNSPSFIHLLLEKLFLELKLSTKEQSSSHKVFIISAWISEIILCNSDKFEYHFETKGQKKVRRKDRIFTNRIQLRWQQLLSACLESPCVSTPHLLRFVLEDMEHPLPLETRERLLQLSLIYTQREHSPLTSASLKQKQQQQPIYTLEHLHEKLNQLQHNTHSRHFEAEQSGPSHESRAKAAKVLRGSPWQVCADKVLWKNYPLGKVPGQSEDPSCLMLENYSSMTAFDHPVELESGSAQKGVGAASVRAAEGLLWSLSDVSKLKSGLQLF